MFRIILGIFALAQILWAAILLSPDLFTRVSAWVTFDSEAAKTWDKTPSAQITISPAGTPVPAAISQITTTIPAPPNRDSH